MWSRLWDSDRSQLLVLFTLTASLVAPGAQAEVVYTYQGLPFATVAGPYTTDDRVTGTITLAAPLPVLLSQTNISELVADFVFADGVETYRPATSILCAFEVATNAAGQIASWSISLRRAPLGSVGDPISTLDTSRIGDLVGVGPTPLSQCATISLTTAASSPAVGSWSDNLPAGTPTTYVYEGAFFDVVMAPYTTLDRVMGTVLFADRLPPFLPPTDVRVGLEGFSFHDGVATRTQANSEVCSFTVATDGGGDIIAWTVGLRQRGVAPGDAQHSIDVIKDAAAILGDVAGTGPAVAEPCDMISLATSASSSVAGSWGAGLPPGAPTTYSYQGQPFTSADPPYTTDDRVAGFVVVRGALPPLLSMRDISIALDDFRFDDGVEVRTPTNSEVCDFTVTTDAVGSIVDWSFSLREVPTGAPGSPQNTIDSVIVGDVAGSGPAGGSPCQAISLTVAGTNFESGSWIGAGQPVLAADYDYLGEPFDDAVPPYTVGQRIRGTIRLAGRLPANLPVTSIASALVAFSFSDGAQMRTDVDSEVCDFRVATDAAGRIVQWRLSLRERIPAAPGSGGSIDSLLFGPVSGDLGGSGVLPAGFCGPTTLDAFGSSERPGTWSLRGGELAIPTLSPFALLLLIVALALAARRALVRRRPVEGRAGGL